MFASCRDAVLQFGQALDTAVNSLDKVMCGMQKKGLLSGITVDFYLGQ